MKNKWVEDIEKLSSKLTLDGNYAIITYEPGMSFQNILRIYGISEKRTDLVRSLLNGNGLMYNNDALLLSSGKIIPHGKIIQMPKRVISPEILKNADTKPKNAALSAAKKHALNSKPIYPLQPPSKAKKKELSVRESFAILMSDPRSRYIAYGWCAALAIMISTGVYVALTDEDTPTRNRATSEEITSRETRSPEKSSRYSPREEGTETRIARIAPPASSTKTNIPLTQKSPPLAEPPIAILDPNKPVRDMSNVGTIAISENSSREEIARAIRAFNDVYSPPSNAKHKP